MRQIALELILGRKYEVDVLRLGSLNEAVHSCGITIEVMQKTCRLTLSVPLSRFDAYPDKTIDA